MEREVDWLLKEKYNGEKSEGFFADCERLAAGEPLAYLIGHVPFLGATIHLDSRPLIPRPETEFWTEKAIEEMRAHPNASGVRVLDLCAGSGCIGIAVQRALPNANVDFVEIDKKHHSNIQRNVEINDIDSKRARVFGGDLFKNVCDTYDIILSNPPYIDPALDRTEESVKAHEPARALYGGTNGTEIIARIITESPHRLKENGVLYIEHEPEQEAFIQAHGSETGFNVSTHPDQFGIQRYSRLTRQSVA